MLIVAAWHHLASIHPDDAKQALISQALVQHNIKVDIE